MVIIIPTKHKIKIKKKNQDASSIQSRYPIDILQYIKDNKKNCISQVDSTVR